MKKDSILTAEQRDLVEHYLSIVNWVLSDHITVNPNVAGLGYDDLYQEGCLWLCHAAATYDIHRDAQFGTYARTVVCNGLISYCRNINRRPKALPLTSAIDPDADGIKAFDAEPSVEDGVDDLISYTDTMAVLRWARSEYTGVAKLGIEALELKIKGFNGTEIAAMYGVKPNHVGAWISRAAQKLRGDKRVLSSYQMTHDA